MQLSLNEEIVFCPLFDSYESCERFRQRLVDRGWDWFSARCLYRFYYWFSEPIESTAEGCFGFRGHEFVKSFDEFVSLARSERVFESGRLAGVTIVNLIDFEY